jgi:hypothetical protein
MIALTLSLLLLHAAPTAAEATPSAEPVVVAQQGETLEKLAARTLGDEKAASELRALNGFKEEPLAPGTRVKLPGPERALAASALSSAAKAVTQAPKDAEKKSGAAKRLAEAEKLFARARYQEAARLADEAWALVSGDSKATKFRVEVAADGETEVVSASGAAVRVEAQGVTRQVSAGQSLKVKKGEAPPEVEVLRAPSPLRPSAAAVVRSTRRRGALAPVMISWSAVPGAESYELEVTPLSGGEPLVVTVAKTSTVLSSLEPGRYVWSVRAIRGPERSEASASREFQLVEEALKLEVKGASWK